MARIVTSGCPPIIGKTMAKKTEYVREKLDYVRQITMQPPRGDPNMMGAILTDPCEEDADMGVIFMDVNGYQNMCGHVSMAVGRLVMQREQPSLGSRSTVTLDTPVGLVTTSRVGSEIFFVNVPSFYFHTVDLIVPGYGRTPVDICFGGDFFAMVDADVWGIDMANASLDTKLRAGRALFDVAVKVEVAHAETYRGINKIDVAMIYQKGGPHYRSIVVSDGGYWDKCPCGSGTSALMALLYSKGLLKIEERFSNMSPIGSVFQGNLVKKTFVGSLPAVVPEVMGRPFVVGLNKWVVEHGDVQRVY